MDYEITFTKTCEAWLDEGLARDAETFKRIVIRINRIAAGNFGDHKTAGDGISELRMDFGPGYRVYYTVRDRKIVVLLCGGTKTSQAADIKRAKELAMK